MIGKQKTGRGFNGVLRYVLNPQKGFLIAGNMEGCTAHELSKEFMETRKLNPHLRKSVYHCSLSLAHGESLNDTQWGEIASRYMREMGFSCSQYCVARHTDRDHEHIHIVASRIGLDAKTVSDSRNYRRSEQAIRGIEIDYGLMQIQSSYKVDRRAFTTGELRSAIRDNRPSARMMLQSIIDDEAKRSLTMTDLANKLRLRGVKILPNIAATGRISGLSFELAGQIMKGSDLGKRYTFAGIQKSGILYDTIRDRDAFGLSRLMGLSCEGQLPNKTEILRHVRR